MRIVIHDDEDMEPITVVNIPGLTSQMIEQHGRFYRLPVYRKYEPFVQPEEDIAPINMDVVDVTFEPIVRIHPRTGRETYSWLCFTKAAALAMLLHPDWLPGQRLTVNDLMEQNDQLTKMLMVGLLR